MTLVNQSLVRELRAQIDLFNNAEREHVEALKVIRVQRDDMQRLLVKLETPQHTGKPAHTGTGTPETPVKELLPGIMAGGQEWKVADLLKELTDRGAAVSAAAVRQALRRGERFVKVSEGVYRLAETG